MKIGLIAAMEPEMESFKSILDITQQTNIGPYQYFEGVFENHQIILLQCGIGKVNATIGATLLIHSFQVDIIINTGSAGGIKKHLNIGDVVIPKNVVQHDVDATAFGYEFGQVPSLPRFFQSDDRLRHIALKQTLHNKNYKIVEEDVATGDSFIHQPKQLDFIYSNFETAAAVEMEAAAIAQVCHQLNVSFLIIRSISDNPTQPENHIEFSDFLPIAAENSLAIMKELLKKI